MKASLKDQVIEIVSRSHQEGIICDETANAISELFKLGIPEDKESILNNIAEAGNRYQALKESEKASWSRQALYEWLELLANIALVELLNEEVRKIEEGESTPPSAQ